MYETFTKCFKLNVSEMYEYFVDSAKCFIHLFVYIASQNMALKALSKSTEQKEDQINQSNKGKLDIQNIDNIEKDKRILKNTVK